MLGQTVTASTPGAAVRPVPGLRVERLALDRVDEAFVSAWRDLESRSVEGNAFLSPDFVLPLYRHFEPGAPVLVVAVFADEGRAPSRLVGLALFRERTRNRDFPLPHLEAFRYDHSYRSGLLVDAALVEPVLDAVFGFLCGEGASWHGVAFEDWRTDGPLGRSMLGAAARVGATWHLRYEYRRAGIVPATVGPGAFEAALGRSGGGKDWRKKVVRLIEAGELQWRSLRGESCDEAAVDRFLALEDRGWAREQGTSLRAAGQEAPFREVFRGLSPGGRLLLHELTLRDQVIASSSNFISGSGVFCFKIGWDVTHARLRPGILNELLFIQTAARDLGALDLVDSGSTAGSWNENLWPDPILIQTGHFATSARGRLVAGAVGHLRQLRRKVRAIAARRRPGGKPEGVGKPG
jgi:CelD/BcsL family acetyltransferase involved in cellulose biosynthesis